MFIVIEKLLEKFSETLIIRLGSQLIIKSTNLAVIKQTPGQLVCNKIRIFV